VKKPSYCLVWLLLIYIISRLPLLLSYPKTISFELYRGTLALEMMGGLRLPWGDYLPDLYGVVPLFNGFLTIPFFLTFGPNLFALKLVPFVWHLLSLTAWYFVWREHFSPKQTFFILLFFVMPPPRMTEYTLLNNGYHFEMILWMALSILLFRKFLEGGFSEVKAGLVLGLLGGFSSFTVLTNLVTVAIVWIYLALVQGTKIKKLNFYGVYIPAFFIGFSPLIFYNWHEGWPIISAGFLREFFDINGTFFLLLPQIFYKTIRHSLRIFFGFPNLPSVPRHFFMEGYTLFYLLSFAYLFWKKKKDIWKLGNRFDLEAFGLAFQLLLFALFLKRSDFTGEYYLFPIVPFIGMTLVVAGSHLGYRLLRGLVIFCISAGILGNLSPISLHQLGSTLSLPGYSYLSLAGSLEARVGKKPSLLFDKFKKLVRGQPLSVKRMLYRKMPTNCFEIKTAEDIKAVLSFIKTVELELQPILFEKLGWQLGVYAQFQPKRMEPLLKESGIDPTFHPAIYRGAVQGFQENGQTFLEFVKKGIAFCNFSSLIFLADSTII